MPRGDIVKKKGVEFFKAVALEVDPDRQVVITDRGEVAYEHLVVATGPKVDFDIAPGVKEYAHYVGTPIGAMKIRESLEMFKANPGPVVIGAIQRACCVGAA